MQVGPRRGGGDTAGPPIDTRARWRRSVPALFSAPEAAFQYEKKPNKKEKNKPKRGEKRMGFAGGGAMGGDTGTGEPFMGEGGGGDHRRTGMWGCGALIGQQWWC